MLAVLEKLSHIAGRFFALWILLAAAMGWAAPPAFTWVGPQVPLLLGAIMLGMGMTLSLGDFKALLLHPWQVLGGVAAQYLAMPLLAFAMVRLFELPTLFAVGVVLVGSCPGGTASNVMTFLARGDVALSVAITAVSTLLAPLLTPLLTLWLAGTLVEVSAGALFLSIVKIVIFPVVLGLLLRQFFATAVAKLTAVLPLLSVLAIMLILAFVVGANADRLATVSLALVAAVIFHNLLGLAAGYLAARVFGLALPKRKAWCFEVGMQNSGLAVTLASLHFSPLAALPGALFSLWHNVSGPLLASYWRRRAAADDG